MVSLDRGVGRDLVNLLRGGRKGLGEPAPWGLEGLDGLPAGTES